MTTQPLKGELLQKARDLGLAAAAYWDAYVEENPSNQDMATVWIQDNDNGGLILLSRGEEAKAIVKFVEGLP